MEIILTSILTAILIKVLDYVGNLHTPTTAKKASPDLEVAVLEACAYVGLPAEHYSKDMDLKGTGKLYAVLHRAAHTAGKDHELRTPQDIIDWLAEAPEAT